jgi:hypothetical protein
LAPSFIFLPNDKKNCQQKKKRKNNGSAMILVFLGQKISHFLFSFFNVQTSNMAKETLLENFQNKLPRFLQDMGIFFIFPYLSCSHIWLKTLVG